MDSKQPPIRLDSVTKQYGEKIALDDVTLEIGSGVTGLLGPNGSGKSTLIKSILGLLKIQQGQAWVMGLRIPHDLLQLRDTVGYLPEDDCFIAGLSGIESIRYMAQLSGMEGSEALRRGHEMLDYADIGQERYRNVETYSTGMRQKLKFAQAIVHDPDLLILDEPTSGLDPEQRNLMLRKIKNLADQHGKSVVICTHILHDVKTVCEQVVIMAKGRVRLVDSIENLSRPVRKGVLIEVLAGEASSVDQPYPEASRFQEILEASGFETDLRSNGQIWVNEISLHDRQELWKASQRAAVTISQLAPAMNSLEEIFFNTVKEAERAPA